VNPRLLHHPVEEVFALGVGAEDEDLLEAIHLGYRNRPSGDFREGRASTALTKGTRMLLWATSRAAFGCIEVRGIIP